MLGKRYVTKASVCAGDAAIKVQSNKLKSDVGGKKHWLILVIRRNGKMWVSGKTDSSISIFLVGSLLNCLILLSGDHPLTSSAASPVVALKTHLDSLANPGGNKMSSSSHHKKSDTAFPHVSSSSSSALASSGPSAVVSRFRLRHSGGSGAAGAKKRQLERPLSQIICQLDSALLLNNSPSFSIQQPRSEERLSVVVNNSNSQSAVAEEVEAGRQQQPGSGFYDEDDVIEGIPRAVVQCLDDLENPPIPPMR